MKYKHNEHEQLSNSSENGVEVRERVGTDTVPRNPHRDVGVGEDYRMALRAVLVPLLEDRLHYLRNRIEYYDEHFSNNQLEEMAIITVERFIKEAELTN